METRDAQASCVSARAGNDTPSWFHCSPQCRREAASHVAGSPLHTGYAFPWLLQQLLHACQCSQGPPAAKPLVQTKFQVTPVSCKAVDPSNTALHDTARRTKTFRVLHRKHQDPLRCTCRHATASAMTFQAHGDSLGMMLVIELMS